MKHLAIAAALFGVALNLTGCAADNAPPPVPPPMADAIPKPPVSPALS